MPHPGEILLIPFPYTDLSPDAFANIHAAICAAMDCKR